MTQSSVDETLRLAVGHHQAGRLAEAKRMYLEVLAQHPDNADVLHLLGIMAMQGGQTDQALGWLRQAIAIKPSVANYQNTLGCLLRDKGQIDEAIGALRQAIRLDPNLADAHANLGNALVDRGYADDAILASRRALALNPQCYQAYNNLGNALQQKRELDEAIAAYRQALAIQPNLAETQNNLGNALRDKGRMEEAIAAYSRALQLKPNMHEAYCNLGGAWSDMGRPNEAIASYQQCLRLSPGYVDAHTSLGIALLENGQPDGAMASIREALRLKPNDVIAHNVLARIYKEQGQVEEAVVTYRRAFALKPDRADIHSNLLYALHYHPGYDAQAILEEHRRWAQMHAEPLASEIRPRDNDRSPDRKLKIAFLSPDLCGHPVGRSLLPLFESRDSRQLEIVCYSDVRRGDVVTSKLKGLADQWQDVFALSDERVAEKIRQDRIDILVDTTLHTAHNRLLVFARQPAPVQLTMLGPPTTTGLATMHYRLTDPYLDPPGVSEGDYTETSIRLPDCFWVYQAPAIEILPSDLPALTNGFVTFGCLNRFAKASGPALELWLRILQTVPNSRLMIQSQPGGHLDRVGKLFAEGGIASDRVQFVAKTSQEEYFRRYRQLDICLDPFPYNGHTSSMDGLWMGVPSVALRGRTAVGRGGVSILSNLGLTDWIADSPEQYVSIAAQMAGDLPRLAELRRTLRGRMEASPLMDGPRFARNVESAFRQMWRNWCERGGD
jgi:predicted O-linked N-acetylglucosamine transferase (SPINDLY family)